MKVVSWNCRGVGNKKIVKHAKCLMSTSKPGAICFLETKTRGATNLLKMTSSMGFTMSHTVDPIGFAGGLLLVWNPLMISLQVIGATFQVIHSIIREGGCRHGKINTKY